MNYHLFFSISIKWSNTYLIQNSRCWDQIMERRVHFSCIPKIPLKSGAYTPEQNGVVEHRIGTCWKWPELYCYKWMFQRPGQTRSSELHFLLIKCQLIFFEERQQHSILCSSDPIFLIPQIFGCVHIARPGKLVAKAKKCISWDA